MRTLLAAVTAFMLFATPVVAGDFEDGVAALQAGDHQKAFDLFRSTAEQGHSEAQYMVGDLHTRVSGTGLSRNRR